MASIPTPKPLANGQLTGSQVALYTVVPTRAGVSFFRLVNTSASAVSINLFFKRSGGTARRIIPKDYSLAAGAMLDVLDAVQAMPMLTGDIIEGAASTGAVVDYVIAGMEVT